MSALVFGRGFDVGSLTGSKLGVVLLEAFLW